MPVVKLAACSVCLRTPCACPDPADESDEQAAQEEADYVRAAGRRGARGRAAGVSINPLSKSNRRRARRAKEALRLHGIDVCNGNAKLAKRELLEDPASRVVDMLSDLLHFCDVESIDFATLEKYARANYQEELTDE